MEQPGDVLVRVLQPGISTERYGRLWHLGRTEVQEGVLFGRIGFETVRGADLWSAEQRDFFDGHVLAGVAAPFAIRLSDLVVVFQTRGQDIRVTSFVGALRGLLRDATNEDWRVETERTKVSFAAWRRSVERVSRLRFNLEQPNPNYEGRPQVEKIIADLRLATANLDLKGEDIATDAEFVREALDHVERGYGKAVAVGERHVEDRVVETVYDTTMEGEAELAEMRVDAETGEVSHSDLQQELAPTSDAGEGGDSGAGDGHKA